MTDYIRVQTTGPVSNAGNDCQPEFTDFKGLRRIFGIPRSTAYELMAEGEIRGVSLRRKGNVKGRRLVDCASVRAYFERQRDLGATRKQVESV